MKWTDEEIDHVFKRFASDQKVVYKDAYWSEMEALLDAKKSSKRGVGWLLFSGFVVLFFGFFAFYYSFFNEDNVSAEVEHSRLDEVNNENAIPLAKKQVLSPSKFHYEVNEFQSSLYVDENRSALLTFSSTELALMNIRKVDKFYINSEGYWDLKPGKFRSSQQFYENYLKTRTVSNEVEISLPKVYKVGSVVIPSVRSTVAVSYDYDDNYEVNTEVSNEIVGQLTVKKSKSDLNDLNHSQEGIIVNTVIEPLLGNQRSGYYVGANFGAANSYLKQSKELVTQWSVLMGYDYTFVKNVRLGLGVGFRQQMINDLNIKYQRDYYSLGLVSYHQAIQYDRLNFIDVNVHLHYLYKNFSFGFIASPTFLVAARATIDQDFTENGVIISVPGAPSLDKKYVNSDNFYKFGFNASLSIQYEFKRKFVANLGVGSRFTPFINSSLFQSAERKMPLNIELGLIKRF